MIKHKEVGKVEKEIEDCLMGDCLQTMLGICENADYEGASKYIASALSKTSGVGGIEPHYFLVDNNLDDLILNDRTNTTPKDRVYVSDTLRKYAQTLSLPNKSNEEIVEEFKKEYCKDHPKNDKTCIECALNRLNNSLIDKFEKVLRTHLTQRKIRLPEIVICAAIQFKCGKLIR